MGDGASLAKTIRLPPLALRLPEDSSFAVVD
jgi:hypothetical protein